MKVPNLIFNLAIADIIFFSIVGFVLALVLAMVIVTKIRESLPGKSEKKDNNEQVALESAEAEEVEETPVEEAPVEAEEVEEAHVQEAPVEAEEVEEAPVQETPVEAEEVEETPVEEAPVEAEEVEEAPVQEAPVEAEEVEEAPVQETTVEAEEKTPVQEEVVEESDSLENEVLETKKGRSYNGKYEIFLDGDGYRYRLKASNGEVLVLSEEYTTRDGVIKAIAAVQKNIENGEIKIFTDKHDKYKFKLTSKNYRVLVVSASYGAEKSAVRAAESFKKFALKADIVDVEVKDTDATTATPIEITRTEEKTGGKFVVQKYNGEFSWDLKASNGQILCQADGYTSKAGCLNSIEVFKKNVETGSFKCVKDKTDHYYYKLYSTQNRVCAVGESYTTKSSAESAANSVVSFYKNAEIIEEKPKNTEKTTKKNNA